MMTSEQHAIGEATHKFYISFLLELSLYKWSELRMFFPSVKRRSRGQSEP
jgi:hypothetical protein